MMKATAPEMAGSPTEMRRRKNRSAQSANPGPLPRSNAPSSSVAFGDHLQSKLDNLLKHVLQSDVWRSVEAPQADPCYIRNLIKYVLLEVFSYGPHVTEATFIAIGRFPKTRPDLMKPMVLHDIEEA